MSSFIAVKIKLVNYLYLIRFDKPIGTFLLLWPTLSALYLAYYGNAPINMFIIFILGTFLMRAAGCVINDLFDKDFDGYVSRTKSRPLVTGNVSNNEAIIIFIFLLFLSLLCLFFLNNFAKLMSIFAVFITLIYPLSKRFFKIPQLVLGIAFSFGVLMTFAQARNYLPLESWILFFANIFITLAYDTLYAMADKKDDEQIPIYTSAKTFKEYDLLFVIVSEIIFDILIILLSFYINNKIIYFLTIFIIILMQIYLYFSVKNKKPKNCHKAFLQHNYILLALFIGIILSLNY